MRQYSWKGFEFQPSGSLIDQIIDDSQQMGVAYERCLNFYKKFHSHDRLILIFPRPACHMEVRIKNKSEAFQINNQTALIIPQEVIHDDRGLSEIYDTLALLPDQSLLEKITKEEGFELNKFFKEVGEGLKIKRSQWLIQLLEHYFIERILKSNINSSNIQYLESNIINEIICLVLNKKSLMGHNNIGKMEESITKRAIQYIEANLFSPMTSDLISTHSHTSKSTLFRTFKRNTGKSPYQYIKDRRLEESKRLLLKGTYSVSEVAILVGYENFGAFSEAFKKNITSPHLNIYPSF